MDIYLLEAIINGLLLGGVLALLALGLNLIFGVIDVVWIAYADIVMCGMYVIYFLYAQYGVPLPLACLIAIAVMAAFGVAVHLLIIAPVLNSPPLNQLLATGGLLFFLQSFATLLFGTEHYFWLGVAFCGLGLALPAIIALALLVAPRIALAACFAALVLHTWTYADFLEDPFTWALLAIGLALAAQQGAAAAAPARGSTAAAQ